MRTLIALLLLLTSPLAAASYADHPRSEELLQLLAKEYRFSNDDLAMARRALAAANKVPKLIEAEQNAKEKTLTWTRYRPIHVNQRNIERGAAFMREQADWLSKAEAEFGVPAEVIAAILGVETKWGGYTGPHRVLDSLATQGFDHPRRHAFFFRELAEYLAFCRDQGHDLDLGLALVDHVQPHRGRVGQVDDAPLVEGPAIIDPHDHASAVAQMRDPDVGRQRQRAVEEAWQRKLTPQQFCIPRQKQTK